MKDVYVAAALADIPAPHLASQAIREIRQRSILDPALFELIQ